MLTKRTWAIQAGRVPPAGGACRAEVGGSHSQAAGRAEERVILLFSLSRQPCLPLAQPCQTLKAARSLLLSDHRRIPSEGIFGPWDSCRLNF